MPKSLYGENAKNLMLKDAVQDITMIVHPLEGENFILDAENDIVQGSVSIDRYCTTGNDVELGSACSSELKFQLYNDQGQFNDVIFEGAEIFVSVAQRSITEYERKRIVWDGSTMYCVLAELYGTDQIRVVFSDSNAVSGEFECSHFPYSETYTGEISVYRSTEGEVCLIGPRDTKYFGVSFSNDTDLNKFFVDYWLSRQYAAGTPFTVTETVEHQIPGTFMALGRFTVDEAPRKTQTMTVKALDRMAQFNKVFDKSVISFPCSVINLARAICGAVNIPYNEDSTPINSDVEIPACPNDLQELDYTYRDYLIWIGEITGTCSYINENGELTFARYENFGSVTAQITPDMRLENSADLYEENVTITGVQATLSAKKKKLVGTEGKILNIEGNQLLNQITSASSVQAIITNIYNAGWGGLTYRPYSATCKSVPYLWPLDKVQYETLDGDIIDTIVTHSTWTLNGNSVIRAKGTTATKSGYAKSDYLTSRERAVINAIRADEEQKRSDMEQAAIQLNSMILNGLGLYYTEVEDSSGGKKIYAHNAATLEDSATIYTMNSGGFAWTNSGWNGDETVWTSGLDKNGNAVLKAITAYHISADDIEAGTLRSQNNASYLNLNNGTFSFGSGALVWNGSTLSVKGEVTATNGTIGGWNIKSNYLSYEGEGYGIGLYPERISDATKNVISVWYNAKEQFTVKGNGKLTALNADIVGTIRASDGSIGGWNINSTSLFKETDDALGKISFIPGNILTTSSVISVETGGVKMFCVSGRGKLMALDADITGKITAESGSIGGWNISDNTLSHSDQMGSYTNTIFINPMCIDSEGYQEAMSIYYKDTYTFVITQTGHIGCTGGLSAKGTISFADVYSNSSSATSSYVRITSSGQLVVSSSSKRYKRDVTSELTDFESDGLLNLKLKQYRYNHGHFADDINNDDWYCGFIAEDVAECYPYAAIYNSENQVEMWDVERIVPPMLDLIQKLYKRVEALENKEVAV